jgi:hypothetical protein
MRPRSRGKNTTMRPNLTDAFLDRAEIAIGGKVIRPGGEP